MEANGFTFSTCQPVITDAIVQVAQDADTKERFAPRVLVRLDWRCEDESMFDLANWSLN